jgi:hypothetical protein
MRLLLDANVILDSPILEKAGLPRDGKAASERVIDLCDRQIHHGLAVWHTLPIISFYHRRQKTEAERASMMDGLLDVFEVPMVGHPDAIKWRSLGTADFEDALQVAAAIAGHADRIVTRNVIDFAGSPVPAMTPEEFLRIFQD